MTHKIIHETRRHFLKTFGKDKSPLYPYLPRHVHECEKWAKKILQRYPKADKKIVLLSVWLHDIGHHVDKDKEADHAVKSEIEVKRFLNKIGLPSERIKEVAHCVRSHRCKDVQPKTLEAKILAAADSASHLTDFNYIVHVQDGMKDYAFGKLERDFRDVGLFPELQKELAPLYRAWKKLLNVLPGWPICLSDIFLLAVPRKNKFRG